MARFNEILAGRYNRYLQKLFQLKGGPPAAQLASEVMPTFSFFTGVEHRYLEGWNRYWAFVSSAAVAAQFGKVRWRIPRASGSIAVLEKVSCVSVAPSGPFVISTLHNDAGSDLASLTAANNMDIRTGQNSSTIVSQQTSAAVDLAIVDYLTQAQNGVAELINFEEQEFTILPGDTLQIRDGTPNQALSVSAIWRERSLEDSELK